jgi:MraZ protein
MLLGQYDSRVDEKNRIILPKRFKEELGGKFIATKGFEHSIIIISENEWKQVLEVTEGRSFLESGARETQRFLLGGASFVELDKKGRFILPGYLKIFADIKEEVTFVGLNWRVEMWNKKHWEEHNNKLEDEGRIETIAERLTKKDNRDDE